VPLSKSIGFCIRRLDFSETSQVVTFYTRDYGRLDLIAKGAKRKRSPTQGRIDLFACGELVFVGKRQGTLHVLAEFNPRELFEGLRRSLPRAYSAFYVAELLDRSQHGGYADARFYAVCEATLRQLAVGERIDVSRMIFEAHLLDALGVAPQVQRCVECGGRLPTRGQVAFAAGRGGALCKSCASSDAWWLPAGALGIVEGLRRASPGAAGRIRIPSPLVMPAREVLRRCIVHALEREPRMMRLV
jgi:DNA repair protein RecO (recombination protein O)